MGKVRDTPNALLKELLDRLNYVYLRTDGTYGDLDYLVSDFVNFIHKSETYKNLLSKEENNIDIGSLEKSICELSSDPDKTLALIKELEQARFNQGKRA